jgi:hypothetical protein
MPAFARLSLKLIFIKFCNPFVFITIQNGWGTYPLWLSCALSRALFPDFTPPFAGETLLLAESRVRRGRGVSILAWRPQNGPREVKMAERQTSSRNFNATIGALLLALGLFMLFANLDQVARHASPSLGSTRSSLNTAIELGLTGLRAVQTYFFDQPTFRTGLHLILVSFWPLILVIIGAILLQNAVNRCLVNCGQRTSSPFGGIRQ